MTRTVGEAAVLGFLCPECFVSVHNGKVSYVCGEGGNPFPKAKCESLLSGLKRLEIAEETYGVDTRVLAA